jgi:hypothetical protein
MRRHALDDAYYGGWNLNKGKEGVKSDYAPLTVRCAFLITRGAGRLMMNRARWATKRANNLGNVVATVTRVVGERWQIVWAMAKEMAVRQR